MTLYNWMCLIGVPAMVTAIFGYVIKRIKKNDLETTAVKYGLQALLRNELRNAYKECAQRGSATTADRDNYENMYSQYHKLGANGVMDDERRKFLSLPIKD